MLTLYPWAIIKTLLCRYCLVLHLCHVFSCTQRFHKCVSEGKNVLVKPMATPTDQPTDRHFGSYWSLCRPFSSINNRITYRTDRGSEKKLVIETLRIWKSKIKNRRRIQNHLLSSKGSYEKIKKEKCSDRTVEVLLSCHKVQREVTLPKRLIY